jgi:hypothetical protein
MISKVTDAKGADSDIDKDEQNGLCVSKDWAGWARQRTIMLVLLVLLVGHIPEFQNGLLGPWRKDFYRKIPGKVITRYGFALRCAAEWLF